MPVRTLYSTYYGLTSDQPEWEDCTPFLPLHGIEPSERAWVGCTGLQRVSRPYGEDFDPDFQKWKTAQFEIFKGENFEIVSRRYA
jgi:hypothetical protein